MGCVYLLMENNDETNYKIGVTRGKLENRIKKLQTGNSNEISICSFFETEIPFLIEKKLHNKYLSSKVINEWYHLSDDEVFKFRETCKQIEDNIFALKDNPYVAKKINKFNETTTKKNIKK